jgi:DNA topoisomerase-3
MQPLLDAARCRSESDWLIGINGTRAVTIKRNKASSRQVSTVGRVQTPTLSLVIEREHEIQRFKPQTFTIRANFEIQMEYIKGFTKNQILKKTIRNDRDRLTGFGMKRKPNLFLKQLSKRVSVRFLKTKKRSKQSSAQALRPYHPATGSKPFAQPSGKSDSSDCPGAL